MVNLCSQRTPNVQMKYFMFDWTIYSSFVINRSLESCLFPYHDILKCLRDMKYSCNSFETRITRNDLNGESLFHLPYLIKLKVYLCTQWKPNVQIKNFMSHWSICSLYVLTRRLDSWFIPNHDIRICLLNMSHSWTKNAFWGMNNKKWRKWCKCDSPFLFNNTYGLPVLTMDTKYTNKIFYDWWY
jgi:hypothetical protein